MWWRLAKATMRSAAAKVKWPRAGSSWLISISYSGVIER